MKTKLGKLLAVSAILLGFGAAQQVQKAQAEPDCPGTGIDCARAWDGTVYFKGEGY
jgi:hypothetical protein